MDLVKTCFRTILSLLMPLLVSTGSYAEEPLRIATYRHYPPWTMTMPDGRLTGFEIELVEDLCRRIQHRCQIILAVWETIIADLEAGRFDAYIGAMTITEERARRIRFSTPYAFTPDFFAVRRDSPLTRLVFLDHLNLSRHDPESEAQLQGLRQALTGLTVGVHAETIYERFMKHFFGGIAVLKIYHAEQEKMRDLEAGRIDAVLDGAAALVEYINQPGGSSSGITLVGPALTGGLLGHGMGIAMPPTAERLNRELDTAIAAATADGTVGRISLKWFGYSVAVD